MKTKSLYDVHPGVAMVQKWVAELKTNSGRTLEEWVALLENEGPADTKSRKEWLKSKHKFGTNSARWIVDHAEGRGGDEDTPEAYLKAATQYVEKQYTGPKEKLRPIYESLLKLGKSQGTDIKVCPCQTMVPLYRNHVFAQIKPTTNTRIDFGLALGETKKTPKRLIDTGGFAKKDRITHRFEITSLKDIDDEVKRWLRTAYDRDE